MAQACGRTRAAARGAERRHGVKPGGEQAERSPESGISRAGVRLLKLLPEPLAAQLAVERAGAAFVEAAVERLGEVGERGAGDVGKVEVQRLVERRPDELDQLGLGMDGALDAPRDASGVGDEEAGVEAPRASGWGDRAGEKVNDVERRSDAGRRESGPGAGRRIFRRAVVGDTDREAGFLERLADRRQREGAGEAGRGPSHAGVELRLDMRVERAGGGHPPVLRLDPAAGKDELARHEPVSRVPLAHQYPGAAALRSFDQNERRRIARAKRAIGPGGLGHVRSPSAPKPCMHKAHCWPTTAPLARGKMMRLATTVTMSQKAATKRSDECGQSSSDKRMPAPTPWATI